MILIADSGSTKTTWMEVKSGNKIVTEGLNPHFTSDDAFLAACSLVRQHFQHSTFNIQLYFYGAGCGSDQQRERVAELLSKSFGTNDIHVETDMLGACRAVCGREAGLVGILGTGSNACYYDGRRIMIQPPSLGYILGDYASGNHVGRRLLTDYWCDKMPIEVRHLFEAEHTDDIGRTLDAVYHQPHPNRYLAHIGSIAPRHMEKVYFCRIIDESLDQWMEMRLGALVRQSGSNKISLVGGFAKAIESRLQLFCGRHHLELGTVTDDPIEGLQRYHLNLG
ncbi:MAG: hypothetical protein II531_01360 [Bacteroidales bacterium]|nr:hypothetical protein [Bacteroidales bacterium]